MHAQFPVTVVWGGWFKSFQRIRFGVLPYLGTDDVGLCEKIGKMRMDICSLTADLPSISLGFDLFSVLALIPDVTDQGYWLQLNEVSCSLAAISDLFRSDIQHHPKPEFSYLGSFQVSVQILHALGKKGKYLPQLKHELFQSWGQLLVSFFYQLGSWSMCRNFWGRLLCNFQYSLSSVISSNAPGAYRRIWTA